MIALTVRSVSFLDLIVDNGYPLITYFSYSFLNLFGVVIKLIPLTFLITLTIFTVKHSGESEFIILWTAGVKKNQLLNLFFSAAIFVLIFHITLSSILTPFALNKSRQLLGNENFNSFLPTIRNQEFSDSFKNLTFFVEKKINNEVRNIFLHDKGNNLKNFSSNISETDSTTILAKNGIVDNKNLLLFNGHIISSKKDKKSEIIKFDQLNFNLDKLSTSTIKAPKVQETSTKKLIDCLFDNDKIQEFCNEGFKKEIIPTLNRRIIVPFYIPILSIICAFYLIKPHKIFLNKVSIFIYGFILLLFMELAVRYTGINNYILFLFIILPVLLFLSLYPILNYLFSKKLNT